MSAPDTLPANFTGWDKAPDTLPADFAGWDQPAQPKAEEGFLHKAWRVINTPVADLISGMPDATKRVILAGLGQQAGVDLSPENLATQASRVDPTHPAVQGIRSFLAGSINDTAGTAAGFTSPLGMGTAGLGAAGKIPGAVGTLSKVAAGGVGAGFAGYGGKQIANALPGAAQGSPEAVQQALQGGAMVAGGLAGAGASARGVMGDMAGKAPALYQSALKPSTRLSPTATQSIVQTGIREGIPVSPQGLRDLGDLIDNVNERIADQIGAGMGRTVNKFRVASRLSDTANKFSNQVNPNADLNAVTESGNEFLANQPSEIPAAQAQAMKQGTYAQLRGKYGELKSATVESQKALARGLKEELDAQFPELKQLNARDGKLLALESVMEKTIQREGNHQLMGIGTPLATGAAKAVTGSGAIAAVTGVIKAIVDNPFVKSRLAIALGRAGVPPNQIAGRLAAYSNALAAGSVSANAGTQGQPTGE